jgi:hypothetical protein
MAKGHCRCDEAEDLRWDTVPERSVRALNIISIVLVRGRQNAQSLRKGVTKEAGEGERERGILRCCADGLEVREVP